MKTTKATQTNMFTASCADLPLFSGTCQRATIAPFAPTAAPARQLSLFDLPTAPSTSKPAAAAPLSDLPLFASLK